MYLAQPLLISSQYSEDGIKIPVSKPTFLDSVCKSKTNHFVTVQIQKQWTLWFDFDTNFLTATNQKQHETTN